MYLIYDYRCNLENVFLALFVSASKFSSSFHQAAYLSGNRLIYEGPIVLLNNVYVLCSVYKYFMHASI
jgi:hypothetical protein